MKTKNFEITATGHNLLVQCINTEETTSSGLILPESKFESIQRGIVIEKGPGLLIPPMSIHLEETDSIDSLLKEALDSKPCIKYVSLDISIKDIVFFLKASADFVRLDDDEYAIVPYFAIKLIGRPFKTNKKELIDL